MDISQQRESEIRSYSRSFPALFAKAKGAHLYDASGRQFIDFFSGAGALNYGHNNELLKNAIIQYMLADGVTHSLDMATEAKQRFLQRFESVILQPRNLDYKVQFTGPTGTNATEAALKLARKVKKRANIVAFTNGYHGLTAGALATTGNRYYRNEAFVNRQNVSFMPYDGYFGENVNTVDYLRKFLQDESSGLDLPAAVILETVQAEGGINIASRRWLRELAQLCRDFDILLIVDDIQVGVGRTGSFFSFEEAGIVPDMVTLSKSIGGFGLPMALLLIKPEIDQWKPGEHTGTFRGNNLAFVAAAEALSYWESNAFVQAIRGRSEILNETLRGLQSEYPQLNAQVRGKGLIYGFELATPELSQAIGRAAFERGLIIERCGALDTVLKFLPPLVIEEDVLRAGLEIVNESIAASVNG